MTANRYRHEKSLGNFQKKHARAAETLPVGTLVALFDVNRESKQDPPYLGPYVVKRCFDGNYTIEDMTGALYQHDVPRHRLKALSNADLPPSEHRVRQLLGHRDLPDGSKEYKVEFADGDIYWLLPSAISDSALIRKYWGQKRRLVTAPAAVAKT